MGNLGPTELIIIAVVIILLFGAKKMPDMARSLGRSMRIIKAETKGMRQDEQDGTAQPTTATSATVTPTPAPVPTPTPAPAQLPEAKPVVAPAAAAQTDVEKMQKQIDDLQSQLKNTNNQSAPTQAPKNA